MIFYLSLILIIFFQVIRQTHIYHSVGKSRSIVLSSGARSGIELRSPHDVINLGHGLFNLNEQQAKNSLTKLATDAVKSGAGRRLGPFRCVIMHLEHGLLFMFMFTGDHPWQVLDCQWYW